MIQSKLANKMQNDIINHYACYKPSSTVYNCVDHIRVSIKKCRGQQRPHDDCRVYTVDAPFIIIIKPSFPTQEQGIS